MMDKIQVLIADDHRMVREGLKAFLAPQEDIEVIGEARDGAEAVSQAEKLAPDVILLDLIMPKMDGILATKEIKAQNPNARILIITSFAEDEKVMAALKAGATGYLLKDSSPDELRSAILQVFAGESSLSPKIARMLINGFHPITSQTLTTSCEQILTPREQDILKMIAAGFSNQEIAEKLILSVWTVRTHVTHILNKLGLENRTQAALLALKEGIISLEVS
jgi:two-component system, NarL family, response regulator LiaR